MNVGFWSRHASCERLGVLPEWEAGGEACGAVERCTVQSFAVTGVRWFSRSGNPESQAQIGPRVVRARRVRGGQGKIPNMYMYWPSILVSWLCVLLRYHFAAHRT